MLLRELEAQPGLYYVTLLNKQQTMWVLVYQRRIYCFEWEPDVAVALDDPESMIPCHGWLPEPIEQHSFRPLSDFE